MDPLKPYDITKLCVGNVRALVAPITQAVPTGLDSIQPMVATSGAYAPADDWRDFGAIPDGEESEYTHGHDSESISIENDTGALFETVSEVSRSFKLTLAELDSLNLQLLENAATVTTIAAAAGKSAQKGIKMGSYDSLTRYRLALVGKRPIEAGIVTEPGGATRPRLLCVYLNRVTLAADDRTISFSKDKLASAEVEFTAFPEPAVVASDAFGGWFDEQAGTIT